MNKMSGDEVVGEKEQKRRMERERGTIRSSSSKWD
jgi:hypothetical protein